MEPTTFLITSVVLWKKKGKPYGKNDIIIMYKKGGITIDEKLEKKKLPIKISLITIKFINSFNKMIDRIDGKSKIDTLIEPNKE